MRESLVPASVLIVDDEALNLELLGTLFKSYGHHVETALGGPEALEKIAQAPPDLIYLDVMMPLMDGFEVCRRLRGDPRTAALPIVLVTGLADREFKCEALSLGATDFLSKPTDATDLLVKTRNLLQLKRCMDALAAAHLS